MLIVQSVVPFLLVLIGFILGHLVVGNVGSGIYLPKTSWDGELEKPVEIPIEELDPTRYDLKQDSYFQISIII